MERRQSGYLRDDLTPAEFNKAVREADRLTGSGGQLAGVKKISDLWKQYNKVQCGETLSRQEKEERSRQIRDAINRKALQGNTIVARYMARWGKKSRKEQIAEAVLEMLNGY